MVRRAVVATFLIGGVLTTGSARGQASTAPEEPTARSNPPAFHLSPTGFPMDPADRLRITIPIEAISFFPRALPRLDAMVFWMPKASPSTAAPAASESSAGAARRSPARAASSCSFHCTPPLPFHDPPIDAESVLARCHTGLLGSAVGILHVLSAR